MAKLSLRWAILAYLMSFALVLVVWIGLLQGGRMPLLLRDPWATYICVAIITILGALGLGLIVSRQIIRPILRLCAQAKSLASGERRTVFQERSYREVAELSDSLNMARQELEAAEELRREMLVTVSHDLRTPLSMIAGYAEAMRDLPGENTPENIQVILDEAGRLSSVVNDVLDRARRESFLGALSLERFDYGAVLRWGLSRYQALSAGRWHVRCEGPRHVTVRADRVKVSRVLYNLLNNAVDHGGADGEVVVRTSIRGAVVRTEVIDRGPGIDTGDPAGIWREHLRCEVGEGEGHYGLGLAIVRRIMEMHGMDYGADNVPGGGAVFWFELSTAEK